MNMVGNTNSDYFSYLALDASLEEFEQEVVSVIERDNNDWILDKTDGILRENLQLMKELIADEAAGDKEVAIETIELITQKIGLLRQLIDTYNDNVNLATGLEQEPGTVKLLFARNKFGNVMIQRDLNDIKKFGDEKYRDILALIERVANGDTDFNAEKQKPLVSSNKLKGIYEMKDFQLRLIYMREGEYTIIIGACVKKDDNDLRYRDGIANMKKQSENYRLQVRNGKLDMEEELRISSEFKDELMSSLNRGL